MIVNLGPAAPTALVLRPSLARGNAPRTQQPLRPTASWGCYSSIIALGDSLMENRVTLKRMLPYFQFDSPLALSLKEGLLGTRDIIMKARDYEQQAKDEGAEELTSRHMTQQQNNKADGTGRCNKTTKIKHDVINKYSLAGKCKQSVIRRRKTNMHI